MRRLATGVLASAVLVLTGCSGGSDDGAGTDGSGKDGTSMGSPSGGSGDSGGAGAVEGERSPVSVASVVVPAALTFERSENTSDPELDEVTWTATPAGAAAPVCRIVLGVQSAFPGDVDAYRQYLSDVLRLEDIRDDPDAPEDTEGVVAQGSGGAGTETDPTWTSALRTWVTPGSTKITVSVTGADSAADSCDPEAVVATLTWDGSERPSGASATPSEA
ncbi:hypothetical protein [Phycicoccus flavus]|uniref:Uncharacterized protein n=1 Tax=Phycicoccus flavus TaxID=2502783 RepID=A0A8T6R9C3_9MICO|nr:hypothetical protein [Phycicoccus flavus]NHA69445.1 hypothetical protein [Phycicoccus flavus]